VKPGLWRFLLVVGLLVLSGCATVQRADQRDVRDPLEPINRSIYAFNEVADSAVIRPAAQVYVNVLPEPVRTGIGHMLGNLAEVWTFTNSVLQLKGQAAVETFMRVHINTFFGLAGWFDVAGEMGLPRHKEDFGQTLGRWGLPAGPYLVLPILGPSSVRDALALPVDFGGDVSQQVTNIGARNSLRMLRVTDLRASLLKTTDALREASLDPYSFVRDAYLQKRENDVYDGNPPQDFDYSDPDKP
jgi:phospholipid-binding lipoprotein MlaA